MAGDRAAALALVDELQVLQGDLQARYDKQQIRIKDRHTAIDSEVRTGYVVEDMAALLEKLETRVTAMPDSA